MMIDGTIFFMMSLLFTKSFETKMREIQRLTLVLNSDGIGQNSDWRRKAAKKGKRAVD